MKRSSSRRKRIAKAKRTDHAREKLPKQRDVGAPRRELGRKSLFPVVGIGASAGGLEAYTQLLRALPLDTGMGFVLVQHLDPDHESQLAQILSRATSLPVREITNDEAIRANHVYVIPRGKNLTVTGGVLQIQPRKRTRAPHRPIDSFFESLAQDRGELAVGVVLSGTASDGTLGLEAIKAEGGITFAQDYSAKQDSMPRSAVAAGCVDLVLAPAEIANELARIAKHPYLKDRALVIPGKDDTSGEDVRAYAILHQHDQTPLPSGGKGTPRSGSKQARAEAERGKSEADGAGRDGYRKILWLLRNHSGVDFALYKSSTIQRRINRRVVLSKLSTLKAYAGFLRGNSKELDALYSDVLISVTSFFRNPEMFEVLERKILPDLLKQRGDDPLRCWVLGCSTGQEAYSIAMAFAEAAEKAPRLRKLQIFATDLNDALLDKARQGLYGKSLADDVSPQRLRRFFVEEAGGYRVAKALREMVVFARQNLISDPPFSRMDIISCRNLLIYLEQDVQKRAIPAFHYALRPGGFLLLGASESIGGFTNLFEPVDKKQKIYSKKPASLSALPLPLGKTPSEERRGRPLLVANLEGSLLPNGSRELSAQREADRIIVSQFAPPSVLVNAELQVLQFRGPTGAFLEPPMGKASFDVLKMARDGLMLPLRKVINQAKKANKPQRRDNVRVKSNGETRAVNLEVIPLKTLNEGCFLILFEEADNANARGERQPRETKSARKGHSHSVEAPGRIAELEAELSELREFVQSIQEQHEATNEEVQAANEEVQSANEELQSINEELETSKEELESANEELSTVNEEMTNRNIELNRLNNDLINLQASAKLAVVLFGRDLTIRRFSPQAEKQFGLLVADLGRPLSRLRHGVVEVKQALPSSAERQEKTHSSQGTPLDLEGLVAAVIADVREQEREVRDKDGRFWSLRVRPYMTQDNVVDGAVLVLADIDALKLSEQSAAAARDYAENTVDTVREPLLVLDEELRVESANRSFYRTFRVAPADTLGKVIYDLGNRQWDIPRLRELLAEISTRNTTIEDFEVEHALESLGRRTMLLNARCIHDSQQGRKRILVAIEDVTERKRLEGELRQYSTELSEADSRKNEFLAMLGHELRNPLGALSLGLNLSRKVTDDPARSEELREMMTRQTARIGTLLDQLLDISRVVSGKLELSMQRVDLAEVVRAAAETVRPLIEAQKHELELPPPSEKSPFVRGDAVRLIQVVENLLTNAIKYTDEGGRIGVRLEAERDRARITVSDTGVGISPEFLPRIFDVFTQAPRSLDRAKGGLGLGLPLVRRLVELHGGHVEASSDGLGRGSVFTVSLPRLRGSPSEERPEGESNPPPPGKTRPLRILVVDDEEAVAETLADLLKEDGHATLAVYDGQAALAAVRTFDPEVVLLDLGLPHIDGYEVARRLRNEHSEKKILLIALTGYKNDAARLETAGFDQHLIKPPSMQKLSAFLSAWGDLGRTPVGYAHTVS